MVFISSTFAENRTAGSGPVYHRKCLLPDNVQGSAGSDSGPAFEGKVVHHPDPSSWLIEFLESTPSFIPLTIQVFVALFNSFQVNSCIVMIQLRNLSFIGRVTLRFDCFTNTLRKERTQRTSFERIHSLLAKSGHDDLLLVRKSGWPYDGKCASICWGKTYLSKRPADVSKPLIRRSVGSDNPVMNFSFDPRTSARPYAVHPRDWSPRPYID